MGLRTKNAYEATVDISGLTDDPFSSSPVAVVELDSHGRSDPRGFVAFFPMVVVSMLRACRNAPELAEPFAGLVHRLADVLYYADSSDAASNFAISGGRDAADLSAVAAGDDGQMAEAQLRLNLPSVRDAGVGGRGDTFRATLRVPKRGGVPFVDIRSKNGYFGAWGTLALMEYAAHHLSYEETVQPMAAACLRLLEMATETVPNFPRPLDFQEATALYALADTLATADDPRVWERGDIETASGPTTEASAASEALPARATAELRRRLDLDTGAQGQGPREREAIFEMARLGLSLLTLMRDVPALFPTTDEPACAQDIQLLDDCLESASSADAAVFLAHALARYISLDFTRRGIEGLEGGESSGRFFEIIREQVLQRHLPLSGFDGVRLQQCCHVFRVFDGLSTKEEPIEVPGFRTPFCFGTALEMHGDDPSAPDYVRRLEGTRMTAQWFFVVEAHKHALHITLGTEKYQALADRLAYSEDSSHAATMRHVLRLQAWANFFEPFDELASEWDVAGARDEPSEQ